MKEEISKVILDRIIELDKFFTKETNDGVRKDATYDARVEELKYIYRRLLEVHNER